MTADACGVRIDFAAFSPLCDVDGPIKLTLDALAGKLGGRVYANDRQVVELHVSKRVDRARPRLGIEVWTLDGEAP
jgi:Holliday junction resolvase RusA-like endonuclease